MFTIEIRDGKHVADGFRVLHGLQAGFVPVTGE
jgi:hypothetical protein